MGRCALDPGDTVSLYGDPDKTEGLVYSFTISSARTTNVTFNPTTSFEDTNPTGQYRVRVRSGSLDGTELGVQTGSGAMTIGPLDIGAGTTYYVEVMRFGMGGGKAFSLGFTYPYIERPTPTPVPTQTPRPQPNLDFRLEPNPNQRDYAVEQTYSFSFRGRESKFPVRVRVGNSAALAVGVSADLACDADPSADDEVEVDSIDDTLYVRTCADSAGKNSQLSVMTTTDFELLAEYSIYVAPSILATPAPAVVPGAWEEGPGNKGRLWHWDHGPGRLRRLWSGLQRPAGQERGVVYGRQHWCVFAGTGTAGARLPAWDGPWGGGLHPHVDDRDHNLWFPRMDHRALHPGALPVGRFGVLYQDEQSPGVERHWDGSS